MGTRGRVRTQRSPSPFHLSPASSAQACSWSLRGAAVADTALSQNEAYSPSSSKTVSGERSHRLPGCILCSIWSSMSTQPWNSVPWGLGDELRKEEGNCLMLSHSFQQSPGSISAKESAVTNQTRSLLYRPALFHGLALFCTCGNPHWDDCAGEQAGGEHQEAGLGVQPLSWLVRALPTDDTPSAAFPARTHRVLNEFCPRHNRGPVISASNKNQRETITTK